MSCSVLLLPVSNVEDGNAENKKKGKMYGTDRRGVHEGNIVIRLFSYQIIISSGHSFTIHPELPFSSFTIPRLAHMIPFVQLDGKVNTINDMTIHREYVVTFSRGVHDPGKNGSRLTWHCENHTRHIFKKLGWGRVSIITFLLVSQKNVWRRTIVFIALLYLCMNWLSAYLEVCLY